MYSEAPSKPLLPHAALGLLLFALPLLGACGKKGDPLPPLRTVPIQTQDLAVSQQGSLIFLEMGYPNTTTAGLVLGGIDSVEVYALEKPASADGSLPTAEPYEIEASAERILVLSGSELESKVVGDRLQFQIPLASELPAEPTATIFAVRTTKADETSDLSNRASLLAQAPPAPPGGLEAESRPRGVELAWTFGNDADAFDVYRRLATERGYGEPLRRVSGADRKFLDDTAQFGQSYIYTVRTIAGTEPLVSSDRAGEREIAHEDRFPPRLPANLVALGEREAIRLRWDPSPDTDVAGYILFRKGPAQDDFIRITATPVVGTEYIDRGLASGLSFAYRMQAVDQLGNESRLGAPVSARTQ
jgi:hypothetical protein